MTFDRLRNLPAEQVTLRRLLRAAWRRLTYLPHAVSYRLQAGPGSRNHSRLREYRDAHEGERCFILGNGPSLAETNLSRIRREFTFGLNRIFLLFENSPFRPSYFVCMNGLVLEQSAEEIRRLAMPRFVNWKQRELFEPRNSPMFLRETFSPGFSTDLAAGVWVGATVTFVALQIAYYMGFAQVILIGVDHSYSREGTPHSTVSGKVEDPDHFDPHYFPEGFRWQLPDLRTSEYAYALARKAFEADGRRVVDATIGGKLAVFPKVSFDDIAG